MLIRKLRRGLGALALSSGLSMVQAQTPAVGMMNPSPSQPSSVLGSHVPDPAVRSQPAANLPGAIVQAPATDQPGSMIGSAPAFGSMDGAGSLFGSFGGNSGYDPATSGRPGGGEATEPNDPVRYLFPQDGRLRVRGWFNTGILGNTNSPSSNFNGPYNATDRDEWQFNQAYLIAEYVLPTDGSFGIGGRLDLLYGFDFFLAQSRGLEINPDGSSRWNGEYYGLAIPQAFGQIGTKNANIRAGHFYTIVGYEGVPSANNFFYSHSYSYQFAGPFTHWGGVGEWKPFQNDRLVIEGGIVNGWNNLNAPDGRANFLGRVTVNREDGQGWVSAAIITGGQNNNPGGQPTVVDNTTNRTRYSLIVDRTFGNLEYVFHHWLGFQENGAPVTQGTAWWYGIDQYAFYKINDQWRLGGRFEWFRDEEGTRVGLNRPSNPNKVPLPGNYWSLTVGPNWTPWSNLIVRPELRWDFYDGTAKPFNGKDNQLLVGTDLILRY